MGRFRSLQVQDDQTLFVVDGHKEEHLKIDASIMGCYYFYLLSEGKHPFGDKYTIIYFI